MMSIPPSAKVRIIGGRWRSRLLRFPVLPGLRPTPDRVRETLFNWLVPYLYRANCLDLFAGSGALGFEALSRGAAQVVMVEASRFAAQQIQENVGLLKAQGLTLLQKTLPAKLSLPFIQADLIFLDPPFQQGLLSPTLESLLTQELITAKTRVYLEAEKGFAWASLPGSWSWLKQGQTKEIEYRLAMLS